MAEEVLHRLSEMDNGFLSIENLNLTELPESILWNNVIRLKCDYNQLTQLPELPNAVELTCSYNRLTRLPDLPKVTSLICCYNRLTWLPDLPNVVILDCHNNQLTRLPELPNVDILYCSENQLTRLPELSNVIELVCNNNQLTYLPNLSKIKYTECSFLKHFDFRFNNLIWNIVDLTTAFITIRRWRRTAMFSHAKKKQELHLELLYSPDLPFYIERRESQHWKSQ
jgi:hypothetical protein